jgi:hypothetical protein
MVHYGINGKIKINKILKAQLLKNILHDSEVYYFKKKTCKNLLAVEAEFWRRSAQIPSEIFQTTLL